MTFFHVDDGFHSHNKVRKVIAVAPAALGLWVVAGSWSSANLTDGFVPEHELPWLFTGWEPLAQMLVTARLWRRVKGGYSFHEWHRDERSNTVRNPSSETVRLERETNRVRVADWRRRQKQKDADGVTAHVPPYVTGTNSARTTPLPSTKVLKGRATTAAPPPAKPNPQLPPPHPFVDDGSGKSCKTCGTLKTNKIHITKRRP